MPVLRFQPGAGLHRFEQPDEGSSEVPGVRYHRASIGVESARQALEQSAVMGIQAGNGRMRRLFGWMVHDELRAE
ncbi:hypothetical protein EOS_41555 [Caballeronia mineralivorans PML1(12)]|uniref:Uncharacterized protein n=1 Tax=Caballeronia mineralivorans PML1(12) TaxID=908627 RepID=A0A0J1CI59_9BURK|nr:hypothetical protein EOS_41555 [Caballeronia mineralivorans PML1(12)]